MKASSSDSHSDLLLFHAEASQERLAASLRLVVFAALLIAVLSVSREGKHHFPLLVTTLAYGFLAVAAMGMVWAKLFHPAVPIVLITLEVILIALQALLFGNMAGEPGEDVAILPAAGIIFIILAHASMRYRPWLVLYTAGLFLVLLAAGQHIVRSGGGGMETSGMQGEHDFAHYQLIPVVTLLLTSLILFSNAWRTRRILEDAVRGQVSVARLSRFFAGPIASRLAAAPDAALLEGQRLDVAVLFVDIRRFSGIVESMPPEQVGHLLTEFREILAAAVREYGGVVDKFIGDAVLAVFGYPQSPSNPAADALACAMTIAERVAGWSDSRVLEGQERLEIGMGAHFGEAFVGIIGRESLLEFTAIGDTVNVAERIERLTRMLDATIAVSGQFFRESGAATDARGWIVSTQHPITGRRQPIDVYYLSRKGSIVPLASAMPSSEMDA